MILRILHVLVAAFVSSLKKLRTFRWNSGWGGNSPKSELLVVIVPAATILDSGANGMSVGVFFLHNDYDNGLLFQHFGLYNLFKSPVHFLKLCCLFSYYWVWEFFICFWYKSFIIYILTIFFQFVPWLFIFFLKNFIIYYIFFFAFLKIMLIYLLLAAMGLRCCMGLPLAVLQGFSLQWFFLWSTGSRMFEL